MSNNLYFISILTDAFRHPDPVAGLREAFNRILERRDDPAYRVGYQQWLRFFRAAAELPDSERDAITKAALRMAVARIAADAAAREPQGGESAEPDARRERCPRPIAAMHDIAARTAPLTLLIHRGQDLVASFPLPPAQTTPTPGIQPGFYTATLDTGWLVWSGELGPADLLWRQAFPGRPLGMAAESSVSSPTPARRITLAVGALTIVVYPGMETGSIQLVTSEPIA